MISVRDLHKSFGSQKILRGVNLDIQDGETLAIIGTSGGGKSVLLRHITGLTRPTSGTVLLDDIDITKLSERKLGPVRKKLGILFQNGALFDSMNVGENVAFPLIESGERDKKLIQQRVEESLEVVGLKGQAEKMPVDLSGGMRKRVALARAIIPHPAYVLYDEPTAGLDPIMADSIDKLIRRMQKQFEVTQIVVTHDMKSVATMADRVAFLLKGKIYFYGTPDELTSSDDKVIQQFVQGVSDDEDVDLEF